MAYEVTNPKLLIAALKDGRSSAAQRIIWAAARDRLQDLAAAFTTDETEPTTP